MADDTKRTPKDDEDLLEEIRDRFAYAYDAWKEIHDEGDIDMRYVAGDPWDPKDRREREEAGRPCLALDELGQYYNQVINDIRANPIAMKFDPTGNGANDKGALFYSDKSREIEYRSNAQIGYTTAFQNCVQRSYGWVRLTTKYAHDLTEEQDICIEDIPDPSAVIADPDAKRPDSSDIEYLFYLEGYSAKEFKRRWPDAKFQDFTPELMNLAPLWIKAERIQVGEYWKIKKAKDELWAYQHPSGQIVKALKSQEAQKVPPGFQAMKKLRDVETPSVCKYITNGIEILETVEWAGKYIPFASCFGNVIYVKDGGITKRKLFSQTRLARGAHMLYCYYRTAQAEVVGRATKNAATGYKGQFDGHEDEWHDSIHQPMAYVTVEPAPEGWNPSWGPAPLPQINSWEPPIQALEMGAEGARRAIQAAMMGSPLPTDAQRQNQKSGVALDKIDTSSQKGSFHFKDHYKDMIRHVAVMIEDLMDKIYDTAREVGVRKANDDAQILPINDPNNPDAVSTKGDYLVTVSTGPAYESQQDAASDFADTLAGNPQVFMQIADLIVKMKNLGPVGDEIADRLTPPQYRQKTGDGKPLSPEAQQAMTENAQLKQLLQQAQQEIATEATKQKALIEKAKIDADTTIQIAHINNAAKIEAARITAAKEASNIAAEAAEERLATGIDQLHDAQQNEADRQHEAAMSAMEAQHSANAADQSHQQGMEAGDVGHQQAMEQAANQAALQPPPQDASA